MSAVLAKKQGGTINILKLIKLLYLADRESMDRYGAPISFDSLFSMDKGPMLSTTLNLINGFMPGSDGAQWEEWINSRENHDVSLKRRFHRSDLDELSNVDLEILEKIWSQFGKMDQWALVDYTHDNCAEWKDPQGTRIPIEDKDVFLALGKPPEEAEALADDLQAKRELDELFARL